MTEEEREKMRTWVKNWKTTGEFLERLKIEEFRRSDLTQTILSLTGASESALSNFPPIPTSGFIKMHEILKRFDKK